MTERPIDKLSRYTCKLCGGVDGHKPECRYFGTCPWCGVAADAALMHGHHPDCPEDVREREPDPVVADEDDHRPRRKRTEHTIVTLGPDGVAVDSRTTAIEVEYFETVQRRVRLHVGETIASLPPLTPLVDGLLFLPGESALYSPPKKGKTFVALDVALSVASGEEFMGRPVKQSRVLYVAAEGVGGLGARVEAWCQMHPAADISQAAFLTAPINLLDDGDVAVLVQAALGVELVVIDTLARCSVGADENSAKDMGRVVTALDRIRDATGHVCVVHHAGKDTSKVCAVRTRCSVALTR
jgi:hypothetical protein